jgi:hypothetical protein
LRGPDWKKMMLGGTSELFERGRKKSLEENFEQEREQLHAKIGKQSVEIDFLLKKSKQLGL